MLLAKAVEDQRYISLFQDVPRSDTLAHALPDGLGRRGQQHQHSAGREQQQLPVPGAGPFATVGEGVRLAVAVVEWGVNRVGVV